MIIPYLTIAKWVGGIVAGLALAWIFYAGLIRPTTKPNPTTKQEAQYMTNYNYAPRISFGCSFWKLPNAVKNTPTNTTVSD